MAEEAFALSPISARATQPSEEDYDAISQAFLETSRGRWFLGEYAKRNRNADTRMVLDAVARIEESMAAQRPPPPAPDDRLPEAKAAIMAALRAAVDEARAAAEAAIDGLELQQHLAPVRKGARVIREIAWRLREIGADGRICDLIDSQVAVIEAGCGQLSSVEPKAALHGVFELIEGRIVQLGDGEPASSPATAEAAAVVTEAEAAPSPAMAPMQAAAAADDFDIAASPPAASTVPAVALAELAEATPETAVTAAEAVVEITAEADDAHHDAHDEALLDMIALEMAAPDPSDDIDDAEADLIHAEALTATDFDTVTPPAESSPPEPEPAPSAAIVFSRPPVAQPQPSLGSSLLESGIVRRPAPSVSDPLAPIRRMSQAEKIAFFS